MSQAHRSTCGSEQNEGLPEKDWQAAGRGDNISPGTERILSNAGKAKGHKNEQRDYADISYDRSRMGKRVRTLREGFGVSQMELSGVLGVSMQTLSYIESGKRDPKAEVIYRISEYFGVPVDLLFYGDDTSGFIDKGLADAIRRMDYRQQSAIRELADAFLPKKH